MRSRWTRRAALPLMALTVVSCSDGTGPGGDLTDFLLDFCSDEVPVFLAVQNGDGPWTRVTADVQGTFSFQAAERFGVAIVHQQGSEFTSEFVFATDDELAPLNGVACIESDGTKTLNGSVTDVVTGERAVISMSEQTQQVLGPSSVFAFTDLPSGPLDLIAHRDVLTLDGAIPDAVIVRRAVNLTSNANMPVLDFGGSEAQPAVVNTLTVTGLVSGEENSALLDFRTATGTVHPVHTLELFTGGTQEIYGIPSALTQTGDVHDLDVFAWASDGGSYRGLRQFYRAPSNRVAALGVGLNTPSFTNVTSTAPVIVRMQLQAQAEYDAFVWVNYLQEDNVAFRDLSVIASAAYVGGTPTVWNVSIPDLSGVSGFPSQAALQPGLATSWYVDAFGAGTLASFLGFTLDGAFFRYANRNSAIETAQLARAGEGGARPGRRASRLPLRAGGMR